MILTQLINYENINYYYYSKGKKLKEKQSLIIAYRKMNSTLPLALKNMRKNGITRKGPFITYIMQKSRKVD